jgi:hypothetical protein
LSTPKKTANTGRRKCKVSFRFVLLKNCGPRIELWDESCWGCYSIVWLRELVLGLLEALTTSKLGCTIPTLVDMGNSG